MQNNQNKITIIVLVIAVVILSFVAFKPKAQAPVVTVPESAVPAVLGNKDDLVAFKILPGSKVSGKMELGGIVKGGYFFEANIVVKVLDANKNELKTGNGTATTDWMTADPVTFTTTIDFTGLTPGPGYIALENDNPSGDPANLKQILIPVVIQ